MDPIPYINRETKAIEYEKVYGGDALAFLYGNSFLSRWIGRPLMQVLSRVSFFSTFYGWLQRRPASRKKIRPFIAAYHVDASEFADPVDSFDSFDAFFVRKLKVEARPIAAGDQVAVMPADGRYRFYPDISAVDGFLVKGKKFSLDTLFGDAALAARYAKGTMVMARLCPKDYHRYHFPCSGKAGAPRLINGALFSVNPIALRQNIDIFTENKRMYTLIESSHFGLVAFVDVGATNVGSIHQTYAADQEVLKGQEKGYFSFGGSSILLFFEPGRLQLASDLLELSKQDLEILCLMGQPLGTSTPAL